MKLVIFGSTGSMGQQLVVQALELAAGALLGERLGVLLLLGELDTDDLAQTLDCLGKCHLMHPHEEMISISPCATTEAMEA